jgi:uncharacterized repeat protein (TIGR01451 family)
LFIKDLIFGFSSGGVAKERAVVVRFAPLCCLLLAAAFGLPEAHADGVMPQVSNPAIKVKVLAEIETNVSVADRASVKLGPADRVVPGDQIIYTVEIRNTGALPVNEPTVVYPVPEHMQYIADSASGPGAQVAFSIDGGHSFDQPQNLTVTGSSGHTRPAGVEDYTTIRWQLKNRLNAHSVAYARFRAIVK